MASIAQLLAGDKPPRLERELLLAHLLERNRSWLYAHPTRALPAALEQQFVSGCERLAAGEPLAYLLGAWEFFSLPLKVTPDTLIPRPETEQLVELALSRLNPEANLAVLDLGTGSGAVALAIAAHRPCCQVTATDVSPGALAVARDNSQALGLGNVQFRLGSWWQPVIGERFDMVLSNPPYVAINDPLLDAPGEPDLALLAGPDGLAAYREIVPQAPDYLYSQGSLLLEHGHDQRQVLQSLTGKYFATVTVYDDLAGKARIVEARL